ncbi:MAG TPA: hypothetical protein DG753_03990, partial [Clostridium sp.]|nr:hypothetical protein [Clostridium sp.]
DSLNNNIGSLNNNVGSLNNIIDSLKKKLNKQIKINEDMVNSKSWRYTKVIRKISSIMKGL